MPNHHSPHNGPHHGPEWIVAVHDDDLPRLQYAQHICAIGNVLADGSTIEIADTQISVPSSVEFDLRYERGPDGAFALLIRAAWPETIGVAVPVATARGLVIRASRADTVG